jgi:hypothetical protein
MIKTELPKHFGEKQFAQKVNELFNDHNNWLWFNVQIPRAGMSKEVDGLIYSKTYKMFLVIEVKGFKIDGIEEIRKGVLFLNNGEQRGNPWLQASDNAKKFKTVFDYLIKQTNFKLKESIYFTPIVALPLIYRNEFKEHFMGQNNIE